MGRSPGKSLPSKMEVLKSDIKIIFEEKDPKSMIDQSQKSEEYHRNGMTEMIAKKQHVFNPEFAGMCCGNAFVEGWQAAQKYYEDKINEL